MFQLLTDQVFGEDHACRPELAAAFFFVCLEYEGGIEEVVEGEGDDLGGRFGERRNEIF